MEMHQVRYFVAAARTLNFTRAAEECHVAQPSLTRAVKLLEAELGGELFRRERSLTHLTDFGRLMQPVLSQILESALTAKVLAQSYRKQGQAPLHLAISRTIPMELLSPHFHALTAAFPRVEVKVFRGAGHEIMDKLKKGEVELAVAGSLGEDWERFDARPLFTERFTLVAHGNRGLARKNAVELADLSAERLLSRPHCPMMVQLVAILRDHGIAGVPIHEVTSVHDLIDLLKANLGVGVLPTSTRLSDELRAINVDGLDLSRAVQLYTVAGRQRSSAGSALINLLRAADWSRTVH
jgi:DNA-binding transcriptional LysR family regulator